MKYIILALFLLTLLLAGCTDAVSPERFKHAPYTVSALLTAGKPIDIENPVLIGRGTSLENLNNAQLFVVNADVLIRSTSPSGDTLSFTLQPLSFTFPGTDRVFCCYVDSLAHIIQPLYTYSIEVRIPGHELITAQTTVPAMTTILPNYGATPALHEGYTTNAQDSTYIRFSDVDTRFPVTIGMNGYQSVNYQVEVYCLEDFSTDLWFTTVFFGQEHPTEDMAANYNQTSGESIRKINIMGKFVSSQDSTGNWVVKLSDYRQAFVFYGKYRVAAYVMDNNAFKYRYMPDGYFYGGVHNALGCFGSRSGGTMFTHIVR